jgi:hypothetical protein
MPEVDNVMDVDPNLVSFLDPIFVSKFVDDINYCDRSEAPPTNARHTNALLFRFNHHAPTDSGTYRGVLIYSPPFPAGFHPSLGSFNGTGYLVSGGGSSPWVRIRMMIRRTNTIDPATGFYKVYITGTLTFQADAGVILAGTPGNVRQEFDCAFVQDTEGDFFILKDAPEGHTGEIMYVQSTVVP